LAFPSGRAQTRYSGGFFGSLCEVLYPILQVCFSVPEITLDLTECKPLGL
jgi:hypothetical protein